jgi:hypothetical protein
MTALLQCIGRLMAHMRPVGRSASCPPSGAKRKRFARSEPYRVGRSRRARNSLPFR